MKEKKGAVYFLKMNKVDAVKIGHTNQEDVFSRINEVKTYCPYGAELIGFFTSYEANKIEKTLHEKFKIHRLKGEWFNISIEECLKCIEFYREQNEINDRQEFEINYAKFLQERESYSSNFEKLLSDYLKIEGNLPYKKRIVKLEFYNNFMKYACEELNAEITRKDLSTKALTMLLKSYCKKNYKTFLDGNSNGVRWFSIS